MSKDNLCILPFIHFNIAANGQATVCCVSDVPIPDDNGKPLNVRHNSLDEIWGSNALKSIRADMLANRRPAQCQSCYKYEDATGQSSHRIGQNWQFLAETKDETPASPEDWTRFPKTAREDLSVDMGKPVYFDLRFDNICNLQCVICFGYASSRIEADEIHRSWTGEEPIERWPNRFDQRKWVQSDILFEELCSISTDVKYIQLAGGEPFRSSLALRWLRHLNDTGRSSKVTLKIFTNLTKLNDELIELIRPFRMIDMTLSIDGTGSVYEYVRYPGKWENVERNAQILAHERDHGRLSNMTVNINATMSAQGGAAILDLFDFAKQYNFGVTLGNAMEPPHAATKYLPTSIKKDLIETLENYASQNPVFPHLPQQIAQWKPELLSVDISEPQHESAVTAVMEFTNDMDSSRGLDFRSVLPDVHDAYVDEFGSWVESTRHIDVNSKENQQKTALGEPKGSIGDGLLVLGKRAYRILEHNGGSLETFEEENGRYLLSGWAADLVNGQTADYVCVAIGEDVMMTIRPTLPRPDIQGGFGQAINRAGFKGYIARQGNRPTTEEPIRLFTLTRDGVALPIAAQFGLDQPLEQVAFVIHQ